MRAHDGLVLACGAFVVVAIEFIVIGLTPAITSQLSIAAAQAGWLITLFALGSALLGPVMVASTARFRPRAMQAAALVPFAANLLLLAFPSFAVAAVLRLFQGAALPLFLSLASVQLQSSRGTARGVALLYLGVTAGVTIAPPLGAFAAGRLGWAMPMALAGGLALAMLPACLTLEPGREARGQGPSWSLLGRADIRAHLLLSTALFATMFAGFSYIALLLGHAGLDASGVALALLAFGGAGLIGSWLAGRMERRLVPGTYAILSCVVIAIAWLSLDSHPPMARLGTAILIWGMAHSAGFVFCQVRVMAAAQDSPGFAASLNISAANIGLAIGSFLGGLALDGGGLPALALVAVMLGLAAAGAALRVGRAGALAANFDRAPRSRPPIDARRSIRDRRQVRRIVARGD